MRELAWDGYVNCRDLGALPVPGGQTQPGRVARGPRREMVTSMGWQAARSWGLRAIVDLRCPDEVGRRPGDPAVREDDLSGITVFSAPTEDHSDAEFRRVCFPILDSPAYWQHSLRILPGLVRSCLETIAAAPPGTLIHCSAGRDRTGMITALLLANAGVAAEAIADDYAESVRAMAGVASNAPTFDRQAEWSEAKVSSWLAEVRPLVIGFVTQLDQQVDQIGLDRATRDRLRDRLLAPA
ncbi:MAG: tyrosine-protein phosphatase [Propionicimonas sp.]